MNNNKEIPDTEKIAANAEAGQAETGAAAAENPEENKKISGGEKKAKSRKSNRLFGRRLKHGALSTGIVLVFLAIVIAANAVVSLLLERYPISLDVTSAKIYQMDDKTINYIKDIDSDIDVTILMTQPEFESFLTQYGGADYIRQSEETFKKFHQYNDRINIKFIDYNKNPDFISKYSSDNLQQGNVVISSKLRHKVTNVYEFYNIEMDETTYYTTGQQSYTIQSSKLEDTMLSSLMFVTDENPIRAAVIKGHGETDLTYLPSTLGTNNYELSELKLISQELTSTLDAVIIAAPAQDFTETEIKKLDRFLINDGKFGKNLIYLASATQPKLPRLESYLKEEWGVSVGDGYIMETDSNYTYGSAEYPMMSYVNENYASVIADKTSMLLLGSKVRPLTAEFTEDGNRSTSVLFQTQKTAVVRPSNAPKNWKLKDGKKAAYAGGILSTRKSVYNNDDVQSNVSVIGSLDMADALFYYSSTNQQYILNMFDVMTQRSSGITVLPKTVGYNQMSLTTQQRNVIGIIFIGVIPLVCLMIGIVIWIRRRHK